VTTIWSVPDNTGADPSYWGGYSFRNICGSIVALSDGGLSVRVAFATKSGGTDRFKTDHCSIGVWTGTDFNTVSTPVELTFSGGHGFDIAHGETILSDWINLEFSSSDKLVVVADIASGTYGPAQSSGQGSTVCGAKAGATYAAATVTGATGSLSFYCIDHIEASSEHSGALAANESADVVDADAISVPTGALAASEPADAASLVVLVPAEAWLWTGEPTDAAAFAGLSIPTGRIVAGEPADVAFLTTYEWGQAVDYVGRSLRLDAPIARQILNLPALAVGLRTQSPRLGEPEAHNVSVALADDFVLGALDLGAPVAAIAPTCFTVQALRLGTPQAIQRVDIPPATPFRTSALRLSTPYAHQISSTVIADALLPDNIERGARGGPRFSTSVFSGSNGAEFRAINWPRQLGHWSIVLGFRQDDDPDLEAVMSAFYAARGRAFGFLFKDWSDYRAANEPIVSIAGSALFQLQKTYRIGQGAYARKITRPKSGSVVIRNPDGSIASGVTIEYRDGTLSGASEGQTASFEFYVPVRFDMDALQVNVEQDGLVNIEAIELVELME
jgi:uncharacterized protein (TIGR02217 family)